MTPEQTRNYWILEGYPLMPEWIEFCQAYNVMYGSYNGEQCLEVLMKFMEDIRDENPKFVTSKSHHDTRFGCVIDGVFYDWNLGEDHAKQP